MTLGRCAILPPSNSASLAHAASSASILYIAPDISAFHWTLSNTKNSGSGPKKDVSPTPVDFRYSSARSATDRGSRSYPCMVLGSTILHLMFTVTSSVNGSTTAVESSGIRIMSDSLIPFQPAIEDPSNMAPSAKNSPSAFEDGNVTCCSFPRGSVKRRSIQRASLSAINFKVFSDMCDSVCRTQYPSPLGLSAQKSFSNRCAVLLMA